MNTFSESNPRRSTGAIVAVTSVCAVGFASMVTVVALALGGHSVLARSSAATTPHPAPAASTVAHHSSAYVAPSASVATLQRELGQLNYYEGSVDGLMGPETMQAITYLQRDAGLPQTGQMNSATQKALAYYLAHGNSQMTAGGSQPAPTPTPHTAGTVTPSASVATLQRELGQLNYYEGPVNGVMGTSTIQSIEYLQRDAGLPQTGQLNAATETALIHFLSSGNSQMTAA